MTIQPTTTTKTSLAPLPPKTRGFPIVGSLPYLFQKKFDFIFEAREQFGDIFTLNFGPFNMIALTHPRYANHILYQNSANYHKSGPLWASMRTLIGNGLPVSEGDFWLRQRRMMQPHFHRRYIQTLTQLMTETIDEMMDQWQPWAASAQPIDMARELAYITMSVVTKVLFGTGLNEEEFEIVNREMPYIVDYLLYATLTQHLPHWLRVPGRRRYQKTLQTLDAIIFKVIERRRQEGGESNDLITLLLNMVDSETNTQMTDEQLRDEAVALFLAGYETTSLGLSWSVHFLTQHPAQAQKMQAQVDEVLGSRVPTAADLAQLTYPRMVMQEALRLCPPAYWLIRTAVSDDEIDGYHIPAGTQIAIFAYVIHRHPELWSDPDTFEPERFTPALSANRPKLAWLPFGAGQHQCIGKEFSLVEAQLILTRLIQRYQITAVPGRVTKPHISTTLRTKGGVWVRLTPHP